MEFFAGVLSDLRAFPEDARRRTEFELHQFQYGLAVFDSKPMATVGRGLMEIQIRTAREHRGLYAAKHEDAVYVLHAFEKKARKAPTRDIELARARLAQLVANRGDRASTRKDGP